MGDITTQTEMMDTIVDRTTRGLDELVVMEGQARQEYLYRSEETETREGGPERTLLHMHYCISMPGHWLVLLYSRQRLPVRAYSISNISQVGLQEKTAMVITHLLPSRLSYRKR
jgi:hypothetical protein